MMRIRVRILNYRPTVILLACLILTLLLTASSSSVGWSKDIQDELTQVYVFNGSGRHFYLSNGNYNGSQPLIACGTGYHLASFWEIKDVSNLTYDYDHPLAHTKDDSGFGPPSYWYGWVRTGQASSGANMAGMGNCFNWTSSSGADYGVLVRLTNTWEYPGTEIVPWDATSFSCNTYGPVWCVGDITVIYLPQIMK